jgi:hypothetical protein
MKGGRRRNQGRVLPAALGVALMAHSPNICGSPLPTAKRRHHFYYLSTVKSWRIHGEFLVFVHSIPLSYPDPHLKSRGEVLVVLQKVPLLFCRKFLGTFRFAESSFVVLQKVPDVTVTPLFSNVLRKLFKTKLLGTCQNVSGSALGSV